MDSEDLTGRRIGRYEIRSLLGRGGMGAVYRAHDSNLDRSVAIKILPPHLVTDSERVRRFMQEAKSASALNHPHVISIYEIGQDESVHYIAMELVEGATLRERMGGSPLEIKRAIIIGEEIAEAIGAAHEAGVVHRDLKPENVIIATAGYVKVLDFGLAKLRKEVSTVEQTNTAVMSTEPGKIMGTVGYMSPEQAEGKPVDHRSDIFSLGCILYEMVSGRSPFRGRSPVDTMHNIVHAEPPPLRTIIPDIPFELQRMISKALAKAPEERYQSAKDLAVDLRRLLRELDSNTSLTSEYGYTPKGSRSRRLAFAALGAVLVVIAVAFVIMRRPREAAEVAPPKGPLTIRRITTSGNAIGATVSPDGKYVAYASSEQGQQGIWLRQLATGQDLQLVPPEPVGIWGHAFSRDGASIYYVIKSQDHPDGTLYAISILGGRSQKIVDGIDSPVTFSPDGQKIAYVRGSYPSQSSSALIEANRDGTGMRVLAKRSAPEYFVPVFYTGPSWSPDGKRIAAAVMRSGGSTPDATIVEVDVATGAERVISSGWEMTQQVAWLPDGKGLIAIGSRRENAPQVWRIPWPSGEPQQITNDLFDYRMASVTADGSTIVSIAADVDADLWHVPADAREAPRKLRGGKAVGLGGISVAPNGSIAYASLDSTNFDIWITDSNGTTARQVTNSPDAETNPTFTPDGKAIVFSGYGLTASVRRIAADGSQTRASDVAPTTYTPPVLSPDGRTLVFGTVTGLAKMPATGGAATALTDYPAWRAAVSPDGARVACYCRASADAPIRLCILPMSGGAPTQTFDAAGQNFASMIQWRPDGRALLVNTMPRDRRNIWLLPLDGSAPRALTNFTDQTLFQFDVTPDRKAYIVSRGEMSRDAVMITGFR